MVKHRHHQDLLYTRIDLTAKTQIRQVISLKSPQLPSPHLGGPQYTQFFQSIARDSSVRHPKHPCVAHDELIRKVPSPQPVFALDVLDSHKNGACYTLHVDIDLCHPVFHDQSEDVRFRHAIARLDQ